MVLPPPNVTGNLHLGHALTVTIQDAMCRQRRMQGQSAIWHPGFDHAGIATQVIVERQLWHEQRLRRSQLSRQAFLQACEKWKENRIADMCNQLEMLGATLNWNTLYYTMDSKFHKAITSAFCKLYSNGLIFNDFRMVNWCPELRSVISDQEVDIINVGNVTSLDLPSHGRERRSLKVGIMYKLRYNIVDSNEFLEVATTRPETTFADVALVVCPTDMRYAKFIGTCVRHPLMPEKILPVLGDHAVKPDKGTGVLKLTPGHDFTDFEIARRHTDKLESDAITRSCIDESGCLINSDNLNGIERFDAREKVIGLLIDVGKYGGEMPHSTQQIRVCNRTGAVIEPVLKKQWFLNCQPMHQKALEALNNGELTITPKFMRAEMENWLYNNEPWCLSRQLDWGHPIPAFRIEGEDGPWIISENAEALRKQNSNNIVQDPDVLDTWFCSALIPIVLAGWPEKPITRPIFSVLETGHDIIGFWVTRMIIVCQSLTGVLPFREVVLHGMIRDAEGRKMSKSLGNVIDPLDVVEGISLDAMLKRVNTSALSDAEKENASLSIRTKYPNGIKRYGVDALRFALLRQEITVLNINLDVCQTAEEGLRFCNKLWNLCHYIEEVRQNVTKTDHTISSKEPIEDRWIKSRAQSSLLNARESMQNSCPHLALDAMKQFFWADLCDLYLECTKKALWTKDIARLVQVDATLHNVMKNALMQLSVFMPFISEYLFDRLKRDNRSMYDCNFGEIDRSTIDIELERGMSLAAAIISTIRSFRTEFGIPSRNSLKVVCCAPASPFYHLIADLCKVEVIAEEDRTTRNDSFPYPVAGYPHQIFIANQGNQTDILAQKLKTRLDMAMKRREKFQIRAEKYDQFAAKESRDDRVEKIKRKSQQAKGVAIGMEEEIKRLKILLQAINAQ